jgi:hypothetical protein
LGHLPYPLQLVGCPPFPTSDENMAEVVFFIYRFMGQLYAHLGQFCL